MLVTISSLFSLVLKHETSFTAPFVSSDADHSASASDLTRARSWTATAGDTWHGIRHKNGFSSLTRFNEASVHYKQICISANIQSIGWTYISMFNNMTSMLVVGRK